MSEQQLFSDSPMAYFMPDAVLFKTADGLFKPLSYRSFISLFSTVTVHTPLLPPGTRYYASTGTIERVVFELPPSRRVLTFKCVSHDGSWHAYNVPLPTLLAVCTLSGGRLRDFSVFATFTFPSTPTTRLYHCPLPNVDRAGHVCFGAVSVPRILSVSDAARLLDAFLSSPFNFDYVDHVVEWGARLPSSAPPALLSALLGRDCLGMYAALQDCDTFPPELLVSDSRTMADLMDGGSF